MNLMLPSSLVREYPWILSTCDPASATIADVLSASLHGGEERSRAMISGGVYFGW